MAVAGAWPSFFEAARWDPVSLFGYKQFLIAVPQYLKWNSSKHLINIFALISPHIQSSQKTLENCKHLFMSWTPKWCSGVVLPSHSSSLARSTQVIKKKYPAPPGVSEGRAPRLAISICYIPIFKKNISTNIILLSASLAWKAYIFFMARIPEAKCSILEQVF